MDGSVGVPAGLAAFVADAVLDAVRGELTAERERGGTPFPAAPYIALARALRMAARTSASGSEPLPAPAEPLSTAQAAQALQVTTRRVRQLCQQGRLPARRNHRGDWQIDPEGTVHDRH